MIYAATPNGPRIREEMRAGRLAMMTTPNDGRSPATYPIWCADNGCFGRAWVGPTRWFNWLSRHSAHAERSLFATAPDVVGDAVATLARSVPWLAAIRRLGYPAALVGQDGLESLDVPWDLFDVLFVGGTTDWKLGEDAAALIGEAIERGKRVHMGRVNSGRRYRYARSLGCHSVDGTFLAFGPDQNLARLYAWIEVAA